MKHILNNLSQEEKNRIREQHKGGMTVISENFQKLINSKLGNVKQLVMEESDKPTMNPNSNNTGNALINNVATEGIKNVTSEMISSPPFEGEYSGYQFGGVFNNVEYTWNCSGVEGMSGVRGIVSGEILTETIENMLSSIKKTAEDAKANSLCVGFYSSNIEFIIYTTTTNKPKCMYF